MSVFDTIANLSNSGREVSFRTGEKCLVLTLRDPKNEIEVERSFDWREMMRQGNVDQIFANGLDSLYRDWKRSRIMKKELR